MFLHRYGARSKFVASLIVLSVTGFARTEPVSGKDFFVTVGGGPEPTSNQISLERNVKFFQRVLRQQRPDAPDHYILFSDGNDPRRDVQYQDPQPCGTVAERMLAEIFGDPDELQLKYRNHDIESVQAPARALALRQQLARIGRQAEPGDRVFVYVTAHGGSSDDDQNQHNTVLHLWGDDEMTASEFSQLLDRIPPQVQIVLVMVQCYSGGFAHVIFDRADAELGLSSRLRCGFFSQVHNREAAGCTADANEENYQEYSSYFWAALAAESRSGQALPRVDYNQDGQTSLAEAHAYATIESDTVDVPLRTSDALLWHYSRVAKPPREDMAEPSRDDSSILAPLLRRLTPQAQHASGIAPLMPLAGTLGELADLAEPIDRAILVGLAKRLEISLDTDVQDLKQALRVVKRAIERGKIKHGEAVLRHLEVRDDLSAEVCRQWPELEGTITPALTRLLGGDADQLTAFVAAQDDYRVLLKARERMEQRAEEVLAAERHEAQLRRLQRTARRIVLAKNLPQAASAEVVDHYHRLLDAEQATFTLGQGSP